MEQLHGFDFFPLTFDENGTLTSQDTWQALKDRAGSAEGLTDAIFLAHGFRNDVNDARGLYGEFLRTFRQNMTKPGVAAAMAGRSFAVAGVFWPSKTFRESFGDGGVQSADEDARQLAAAEQQLDELRATTSDPEALKKLDEARALLPSLEDDTDAQDKFVALVLSVIDDAQLDPSEGFDRIQNTAGSRLLAKLAAPIILPTRKRTGDEGGVMSVDIGGDGAGGDGSAQGIRAVFGSVAGRVGQFLNLASWYQMKNRCGVVGATGVAGCVRQLRKQHPQVRVHLVGHSLGGRLMAACAKALAQPPAVTVSSLTLLQAAFSHFGLSADNRQGTPGFFRDVLAKQVVSGPMVATFSFQDTVVGKAYAIASRLAGDNVQEVGDRDDPFGGIGRNGAQNLGTSELSEGPLHTGAAAYTFKPRILHCLDGSGGLITSHGDVMNENVTWAFASAVAAT